MFRGILTLTLSLCLGAAAAPTALAQAAAPSPNRRRTLLRSTPTFTSTPIMSMDITRKQFTNVEPGKEAFKGPMNMFANVRRISAG